MLVRRLGIKPGLLQGVGLETTLRRSVGMLLGSPKGISLGTLLGMRLVT